MGPNEWRQEYEQSRYLREINDDALQRRFDDLAANIWSTDAAGNVIPTRNPEARAGLLRMLLHTMLEQMERRGTEFRDFDERRIRAGSSARYAAPRLKTPFTGSLDCYAKFGKRGHIRNAFECGVLRIAPASSYDDPSLNPAQIDKELEHATVTPNEQLIFKLHGLDSRGSEVELPVQKKELFRYMMVPDFYVWCCGLGYDARLFHEFEAEAVLVIRNKDEFRARLAGAVRAKILNSTMNDGPLRYYDPYTIRREQLIPIFSKHFRYLYQNEYRFAWTVPNGEPLKPFLVELGTLNDISEVVELA
jgi:hypothetical protein